MKPNYDKRIVEVLEAMRRDADTYPRGERNRAINRIGKLNSLLRRKTAREGSEFIEVPGPSSADVAARYEARKAIYNALKEGRHLTLKDSEEFRTSEFHTDICKIRKRLERTDSQLEMRDRWVEPLGGGARFKEYWLEEKEAAL